MWFKFKVFEVISKIYEIYHTPKSNKTAESLLSFSALSVLIYGTQKPHSNLMSRPGFWIQRLTTIILSLDSRY